MYNLVIISAVVLIWLMIVPMLLKVDFGALHEVRRHARGIGVTLFVNWIVKPFSMAFLGWLFIRQLFAQWLPAGQIDSYIAGEAQSSYLAAKRANPALKIVVVDPRRTDTAALADLQRARIAQAVQRRDLLDRRDAVAGAQAAFPSWSSQPPLRRARVMFRFREIFE